MREAERRVVYAIFPRRAFLAEHSLGMRLAGNGSAKMHSPWKRGYRVRSPRHQVISNPVLPAVPFARERLHGEGWREEDFLLSLFLSLSPRPLVQPMFFCP